MSNLDLFRGYPYRALTGWQKAMDRMLEEQWSPDLAKKYNFNPSCEIQESKSEYKLKFDLPGIPKDQIKIDLEGDRLTVSGERREEKKEDSKLHHSEVFYGSFMRTFTFPSKVDAEKVAATYDNGVLTVAVAKTLPNAAKTIAVK